MHPNVVVTSLLEKVQDGEGNPMRNSGALEELTATITWIKHSKVGWTDEFIYLSTRKTEL